MRVIQPAQTGVSLLRNGGFEEKSGAELLAWHPYQQGFTVANESHTGQQSVVCDSPDGRGGFGASQTLTLNRQTAAPLVVQGWSKAEKAGGSPDTGYSLYVDIVHDDGSTLWGQTVPFRCGTHGWEKRELTIIPAKPVKTMTIYGLFRGHAGKVWFDDFLVQEISAGDGKVQ